jgi:hypothetical protein
VGIVTGQVGTNLISLSLPGAPVASYAPNTVVTLTASQGLGSTFAGWTGTDIPTPILTPTLAVAMDKAKLITAQFTGASVPAYNLDVNADGVATPQDAIVILRYLSLVTGPALTAGVVTGGQRTDPAVIKTYLDGARTTMLDVNQDGQATPQDAIVILRHLSLVSGPALTAGVITGGAQTDPGTIKTYLNRYTPGVNLSSASEKSSTLNLQTSAASTQLPAGSSSTLSSQSTASGTPTDSTGSTQSPKISSTLDAGGGEGDLGIAATQLKSPSVQTQPWVTEFVSSGVTEEDEEVVVML